MIRALTEYYQQKQGMAEKRHRIHKDFNLNKGNWQWILDIDIDSIISKSPTVSYKNLPNFSNDDIKLEINTLIKIIFETGHEIILVNKTNPFLNIPVFRIYIPGFYSGTVLSSLHENDDLLIMMAYYQGRQMDKLIQYYNDNFDNFIRNFNLSIKVIFPDFDIEKALKILSPKNCALESILNSKNIELSILKLYLMYNK